MNLNTYDWKLFKLGDLLSDIYKAKAHAKVEMTTSNNKTMDYIPFVTRTEENNSVDCFVKKNDLHNIEAGNAITIGDTTSTISYQNEPFGTGDHIIVLRADWMNPYTALFIVSILKQERFRYSYGRAFLIGLIKNTSILLPAKDDGIPDWNYMEKYIKSLHHKPLTTKMLRENTVKLSTKDWKDFLLNDYFEINPGKYYYPDEYESGETPYLSASNENNSISQYIDLEADFKGNCIVTGKIGCTAFYMEKPFCASSDNNIFVPKFNMSKYIGLFIVSVINFSENYKWAYGRQCRSGDSKKIKVKLPVDSKGNPDWNFMDSYIRSLPYGDRI